MTKSIHRDEYQVFLELIRQRRMDAGLTQTQCSDALGKSQSFVSDVERGIRRLDLLQLRDLCQVLNISLSDFVIDFEKKISRSRQKVKQSL